MKNNWIWVYKIWAWGVWLKYFLCTRGRGFFPHAKGGCNYFSFGWPNGGGGLLSTPLDLPQHCVSWHSIPHTTITRHLGVVIIEFSDHELFYPAYRVTGSALVTTIMPYYGLFSRDLHILDLRWRSPLCSLLFCGYYTCVHYVYVPWLIMTSQWLMTLVGWRC